MHTVTLYPIPQPFPSHLLLRSNGCPHQVLGVRWVDIVEVGASRCLPLVWSPAHPGEAGWGGWGSKVLLVVGVTEAGAHLFLFFLTAAH